MALHTQLYLPTYIYACTCTCTYVSMVTQLNYGRLRLHNSSLTLGMLSVSLVRTDGNIKIWGRGEGEGREAIVKVGVN